MQSLRRRLIPICTLLAGLMADAALAAAAPAAAAKAATPATPAKPAAAAGLPRPAGIEPQVDFWRKVFGQYSEHQIILHDAEYPAKIIKVLDFRPLVAKGVKGARLENTMRVTERREKIAIDHAFTRLHAARGNPKGLSAADQRIWRLYADRTHPNRFLAARGRIRAQRGLKERMAGAIVISGRYMPHMERIFRSAGLPLELTRLPFVESSFNLKAYSKVGAAGIWQFIPSSARRYMRLDDIVDDRRDPLFSTEAAAAHLRDDYAVLQAWPLAVTAYNHGRGGVLRGVKQVGSRNLVDLIRRYRSPSWGFASKNFYASFLAASDVHREHHKYFGPLQPEPPLGYQYVRINDYVPYKTLQRLSGLDAEIFRVYNPAYHEHVISGRVHVPPRHRIRVPAGRAQGFAAAYARLAPAERSPQQKRYYAEHKVAPGESLGTIARRYGSSTRAIQQANSLGGSTRIRAGQKLRIPPRDRPALAATGPATAAPPPNPPRQPAPPATAQAKPADRPQIMAVAPAPKTDTSKAASAAAAPVRHRVQRGQTVSHIARQYGTSVRAILSANNISDARRIKPGQVLIIPSG